MKNIFKNKKNKHKGFTLIEVMVAVSIFAIVMVVAVGAVLAVVAANKKAQALNSIIDNLNFSMEAMVRDLRTGYNYRCDNDPDPNSCDGSISSTVTFESTIYGGEVSYIFDGNKIKQRKSSGEADLTTSDIKIEEGSGFYVLNTGQPQMILIVKATDSKTEVLHFNLQTFISQRKLNIPNN